MTREEIEAKMYSTKWIEHPAWKPFVQHFITEKMHYGAEPLNQAWYFYSKGWEDAD